MDPASLTLAALNSGFISVATASALPSATAVLGGLSLASSALGSIAQGRQSSASAKYNSEVQSNNAEIASRNATLAGQEGAANAAIEQQKTRANVGAIKSAQAANGVDVNTGSAVDVRSSASELGELNAITIRNNAVKTAYGFQTSATSDEAQSQLDKEQAKYDTEAGDINAGTTLLSKGASGSQSGLWNTFNNSSSLNGGL